MLESTLKLSTSVIAEVHVVIPNIEEVTDDVDTSIKHDEEEEEAVDRDDDIEDEVSVNSSGSISAKKGRPADTLETLRRKCPARCKDISALKQEVDVLQKELTSLKEKPIGQLSLTINAQTYMALLKSQDNVSVEKIPDTIRNVVCMFFGEHIDAVTMKYLSICSSTAQLAIDRVADLHSNMFVFKLRSNNIQSLNLMMDDSNKNGMAMKLKLVNVLPPYDPTVTQKQQVPITVEALNIDNSASKEGKLAATQSFDSLHQQLGNEGLMKIHSGTVDWLTKGEECKEVMKLIDNLPETHNLTHIIKSTRHTVPILQYEYGPYIR